MMEKLVTIPAKAAAKMGYKATKAGVNAGGKVLPSIKNYLFPVLESVDNVDYNARIQKRKKNKDLLEHLEKNPLIPFKIILIA